VFEGAADAVADGATNAARAVGAVFEGAADAVADGATNAARAVGAVFEGAGDAVADGATNAAHAAGAALAGAGDAVASGVTGAANAVAAEAVHVGGLINESNARVVDAANQAGGRMLDGLNSVPDAINASNAQVAQFFNQQGEAVGNFVVPAAGQVKLFFDSAGNEIGHAAVSAAGAVQVFFDGAGQQITAGANSAGQAIVSVAAPAAEVALWAAYADRLEAQVAALADDIAYNNHDVDDGVVAGMFTLADLLDVPLIGPILFGVRRDFPDLDDSIIRMEAVRRMIGAMVDDVMAETTRRVAQTGVDSAQAVRALDHALVAFSRPMLEDLAALREFLLNRMYRHWRVNRTRSQARRILAEMFQLFMAEPDVLPADIYAALEGRDEASRARSVCDYIAGMTDRFAIEEHRRLFQLEVWS
jgi:hypothetical protein